MTDKTLGAEANRIPGCRNQQSKDTLQANPGPLVEWGRSFSCAVSTAELPFVSRNQTCCGWQGKIGF